jgi:hypothetical protein
MATTERTPFDTALPSATNRLCPTHSEITVTTLRRLKDSHFEPRDMTESPKTLRVTSGCYKPSSPVDWSPLDPTNAGRLARSGSFERTTPSSTSAIVVGDSLRARPAGGTEGIVHRRTRRGYRGKKWWRTIGIVSCADTELFDGQLVHQSELSSGKSPNISRHGS